MQQNTRYGNKAFRNYFEKMVEKVPGIVEGLIGSGEGRERGWEERKDELSAYLGASLGNPTRIDYGSGHEVQFLVFLYSLDKIGIVNADDYRALGLVVFNTYLKVTRKLQMVYRLEPAGSRGVWGLDDYCFLPFLWGSSQLIANQKILPTVVEKREVVDEYAEDYLYLGAVQFIYRMKSGGTFAEHSPLLYDVSQVKAGWPKINQGMCKMYKAEVWQKRPVMQHLLFGKIVKFDNDVASYQKHILGEGISENFAH